MNTSNNPTEHEPILTEIQRLEGLFESSTVHYQSLDAGGNILKVNSSWLKTLGYQPGEVLTKWFGDFLTEDSRVRFKKKYTGYLKSRKNESMELTLICKEGSKIYTEFSCIGSSTLKGKLFYTHCIFQNITKLRLAEQALKESERKYSQLVELSSVGIFEYDVNCNKFTYLNSAIKRELGIDLNTEKVPDLSSYLTADSKVHFENRINNLRQGKSIDNSTEYKVINAKGETLWVHLSNSFLYEDDNIRIIGVAQNITPRKLLEVKLQEYRSRLESITGNLPAVIFQYKIIKGEISFLYVSGNIEQLTGLNEEEVLANPKLLVNLLSRDEYPDLSRSIKTASKKGQPAHLTYQITRKDGIKRWARTVLSSRKSEDGSTLWTGVSSDITDEHELKEKLSQTEARYKALVNSATPGIATMTPAGIVTSVNPRLCELSGYSEENLVGRHFLKVPAFYTRDAPKYISLYNDARKGIITAEPVPFKWKHKSGESRWGEGFLSSIVEDGKVIGYQSVLTDITSRVLLEKKEEQRKKENRILFESAVKLLHIKNEKDLYKYLADLLEKLNPNAYVTVNSVSEDQDTLIVEAVRLPGKSVSGKILQLLENNIQGRKFNITPSTFNYAITGRLRNYNSNIYDLALKQIPKGICDQLEKLIKLGAIYEISLGTTERIMGGCTIMLKKGQEIKQVAIIETLFREASSALVRLRTNKKLDANEKLYRSLAESSGEWIIRFNQDRQHIYVNKAVGKSLKINPREFIGKNCVQMGYSQEHSRLIEARILETFSEKKQTECTLEMHIDGESNFLEWRFYPETSNTENVESVLVNARNITKRKELEGKLMDTISKKNKLYSIISHDLRTPFNSIIGFISVLKMKNQMLSDEDRMKYINIIDDASQNCLSLFESILDWSMDNMEDEPIKPVYFDLGMLIKKVGSLIHVSLLKQDIRVVNNFSENVIVHADYNMIYTVLRNLVSNAVKFSKTGGSIMISLLEEADTVVCKIQDSGMGMSKELVNEILTTNKRISPPSGSGAKGYGLGFRLAREFVEFNGGKVWIESKPGKGTTVFFSLNK